MLARPTVIGLLVTIVGVTGIMVSLITLAGQDDPMTHAGLIISWAILVGSAVISCAILTKK